jgi:hypothetical protein
MGSNLNNLNGFLERQSYFSSKNQEPTLEKLTLPGEHQLGNNEKNISKVIISNALKSASLRFNQISRKIPFYTYIMKNFI